MASINAYLNEHYGYTVRPRKRVKLTPVENYGEPVKRLKTVTRWFDISLEVFHTSSSAAASLETFLATLKDGAVSCTWTNPDPADSSTYTTWLDPELPVPRRWQSINYWEWTIELYGYVSA